MIDAAVVIASWNGKKFLKDCLDSLAVQSYQNFKTFFVDNGSEDGSVDFIKENYKNHQFFDRLEFIRFEKNTGFARAYNAGLEKALEDDSIKFVLILNNDTQLDPGCLRELLTCAQRHPDAASVQPKVLNFFEQGKIDCTGILLSPDGVATNRGYGEKDQGQFDQESEIFGANGTASLFLRQALEKTQIRKGEFFDNDYFAYYEDVDLAWRMRLAGYKSFFCPKAKLLHIHSATAKKIAGLKAYYLNRNRYFTLIKNYPAARLWFILLVLSPARYIFLLYSAIMKKGRKGQEISGQKKTMVGKEIMRAWVGVIQALPKLLKKRKAIRHKTTVNPGESRKWLADYHISWKETF